MAGEFGSVVRARDQGHAVSQVAVFEHVHDVFAGDGDISGVVEDQAGGFVDDRDALDSGAIFEWVGLEINYPHTRDGAVSRISDSLSGGFARLIMPRLRRCGSPGGFAVGVAHGGVHAVCGCRSFQCSQRQRSWRALWW